HHALKQYKQAISCAQKAEQTAKETGSLEQLRTSYKMLALLQAEVGNHALAYSYQQNYIATHDSITNIEAQKTAQEIQTKYETEKKDLEITNKTLALDKANLELNKKRTQLILALIAVVIITLLSYLAYSRYKLKQQAFHDA